MSNFLSHLTPLFITSLFFGCVGTPAIGPGMIVHFSNGINGKSVSMDDVKTAGGSAFSNPGSIAPSSNPMHDGKVMGAAPDGRFLPEWVEFTWIETDYPRIRDRTKEELDALPVKKARISVRQRVPVDVVQNVILSKSERRRGGGEDLSLWVYFVWQDAGVKFRWEEQSGCCKVLRAGGDSID